MATAFAAPASTLEEIDATASQMEAAGADRAQIRRFVQEATDRLDGKKNTDIRGMSGDMGFAGLSRDQMKEAVPMLASAGARYGAPIMAGIATGGTMAIPTAAAITALTGAAGEAVAQGIEGQPLDAGQIVKSGLVSGLPGGSLIKGGGAALGVARIAEGAGKVALAEGLGESAKRTIEQGRPATYDSVNEAMRGMALPAGIGGGLAGLGELAKKLVGMGTERAARTAQLAEANVEKPTLDMIWPANAGLVNRVIAGGNAGLAKQRIDATQALMEPFEAMAARAPQSEEVFAQLRPYVGKLDAMRAEVGHAEQAAAKAAQEAALARQAAQLTPQMRAEVTAGAAAAELNAVGAQAKHLYEQQFTLGGLLDHATVANKFSELSTRLFKARKEVGAGLYEKAGLPQTVPLYDKAELAAAAKEGMAKFGGRQFAKEIDEVIRSIEGDKLTHAQFMDLRGEFADRFAGLDPRALGPAEAAGKNAYHAIGEKVKEVIARGDVPGANLEAYNAAQAYWRQTAEAAASRYVRPILAKDPSVSTFSTLADDLVKGDPSQVAGFNRFVEAVKTDSAELAASAQRQLSEAVRNSFLMKHTGAGGVNQAALADDLLLAAKKSKFDVGSLGFGSAEDIGRWAQVMRKWKVENLGEADFGALFSTPQVQQALAAGKPMAQAMEPTVARLAFTQNVHRQAMQAAIGNLSKQKQAAADAARAADAAGLTLAERRAALAQIEADPIAAAFAGKQTWGIPQRAGAGASMGEAQGITATMLNLGPADGLALNRALQKANPVLAEQVERRVLADVMQPFFRPANSPGNVWALNKAEVERFFQPKPGSAESTHAETIRNLVGRERFAEMGKILTGVSMLADLEKAGGVFSTNGAQAINAATGVGRSLTAAANGAGSASVPMAVWRGFRSLADGGNYRVLAFLAKPGPAQEAFFKAAGDLDGMLAALPFNQTLLLMRDKALKDDLDVARGAGVQPLNR